MGEVVCRDNEPLISVIVPIYKVEPYLRRCVDSILAQTYRNLEIILVDDGSPDGCPAICDEYSIKDKRVSAIHKENGGVSSARNIAIKHMHGCYLMFVDADDYLTQNDYISNLFQNACDFSADIVVAHGNNSSTGIYSVQEIREKYYDLGGLSGPVEKLYKADCLRNIRFNEQLQIGEDIIFNLEILKNVKRIYYSDIYGYCITENPESLTRKKTGRYDDRLDEEYQQWWGKILSEALTEAGINTNLTHSVNSDGCSIWIFQKLKNLCYKDCPHTKKEIFTRISRQLESNRKTILSVTNPTSPKTFAIVKLCIKIRIPAITYMIFRILIIFRV